MQANYSNNSDVKAVISFKQNTDGMQQRMKKKGEQAGKKYQQGFKATSKGLSTLGDSSEMGKIAKLFSSGSAAMAAAGVAIAATLKMVGGIISDVIDRAFLSAQERTKKIQGLLGVETAKAAQRQKKNADFKSIFEALEAINDKNGDITPQQFANAKQMIAVLQREYGKLGIEVDETTYSIKGLFNAFQKIEEINRKNSIGSLEKQLSLMGKKSGILVDQALLAINSNFGTNFLHQTAYSLGVNTLRGNNIYQKIKSAPIEKQIEVLEAIYKKTNSGTDIQYIDKALTALREQIKLQRELDNIKKMGYKTEAEYIKAIQQRAKRDPRFRAQLRIAQAAKQGLQLAEKLRALQKQDKNKDNILGGLLQDDKTFSARIENLKKEIAQLEQRKRKVDNKTQGTNEKLTSQELSALIAERENDIVATQIKQIENLNKINELRKQINKQIASGGRSLLDNILSNDRNYRIQRRIADIQQATKSKLTDKQKANIAAIEAARDQYSMLQSWRGNFNNAMQIRTNEMTARGGFAGGAVTPNVSSADKALLNYQSNIFNMVTQIKNIIAQGGRI